MENSYCGRRPPCTGSSILQLGSGRIRQGLGLSRLRLLGRQGSRCIWQRQIYDGKRRLFSCQTEGNSRTGGQSRAGKFSAPANDSSNQSRPAKNAAHGIVPCRTMKAMQSENATVRLPAPMEYWLDCPAARTSPPPQRSSNFTGRFSMDSLRIFHRPPRRRLVKYRVR